MKLVERIYKEVPNIINIFQTWEAKEQIISDKSTFYMLKDPNSEYQKVCLYSDGHHMFLYGDYGTYIFDDMTFIGNPFNLPYENLPYLLEKMNQNCKETLYIFNEKICEEDIKKWTKEVLENYIDEEEKIGQLISLFDEASTISLSYHDIQNKLLHLFPNIKDKEEIMDILCITSEALYHSESQESYEYFLQENHNEIMDIDDYSSDLFKAGKEIDIRFLISLYAMQVCKNKLNEKEQKKEIEDKEL